MMLGEGFRVQACKQEGTSWAKEHHAPLGLTLLSCWPASWGAAAKYLEDAALCGTLAALHSPSVSAGASLIFLPES